MILLIDCCKYPFPQKLNRIKRQLKRKFGKAEKIVFRHYAGVTFLPRTKRIVFVIAGYDPISYIERPELDWLKYYAGELWFINSEYMVERLLHYLEG
jgi:hypothetical protein